MTTKLEPRPLEISESNPITPEDVGRWVVTNEGGVVKVAQAWGSAACGVHVETEWGVITEATMKAKRFATPVDHCRPVTTDELLAEIERRTGLWMEPTRDVLKDHSVDLEETGETADVR